MPVGRPSSYSAEVAQQICERLATGESVRGICNSEDGLPTWQTVFSWLGKHPDFAEQYARAKELAAESIAEEIFDIADDSTQDFEETEITAGVTARSLNPENIQRSKLRVDARKWYLSKIMPKRYGDKVQQEVSGPDGGPATLNVVIRSVLDKPKV